MVAQTVIYADFSSARCYLASQLVDRLRNAGHSIEWRAIEGEAGLPVGGRRRTSQESAEVAVIGAELEAEPVLRGCLLRDLPNLVPHPTAAVSAYAEAVVAHVAPEVRAALFAAYWTHGADIGDPEKLRTILAPAFLCSDSTCDPIKGFGYAVAMTREPITGAAWRLLRTWRTDWMQVRDDELPVVVDAAGRYAGVDAVHRLAELLDPLADDTALSGVDGWANVHKSHWAPETTVLPPETWTSGVGDPWRRAGLLRQ